jgi:cell shape-determining protein MreD
MYGTADIMMVTLIAWGLHERVKTAWVWAVVAGAFTSFFSALPLYIPLFGYLAIMGIVRLLQRSVWQAPLLVLFVSTAFGTLLMHGLSIGVLKIFNNPLPILESLNVITFPSILLNLIVSLPIYTLINDLANLLYPEKVEV